MHGISLGPPTLPASRAMKTRGSAAGIRNTRCSPIRAGGGAAPVPAETSGTTTFANMVEPARRRIKPFYGPFGDFSDPSLARCSSAMLPDGLRGAWTLHPNAKCDRQSGCLARSGGSCFRQEDRRCHARRSGAVMIDGKMQDDAHLEGSQGAASTSPAWGPAKDPEVAAALCAR